MKSNHNNLSLDVYTGRCLELPVVGESFCMATVQEGDLWTTPVLSYEKNFKRKIITFKTKNSEYELKVEVEK